ncbi:aryl-alcohol dehydrogenase-like predicted oxidoreductase [Algoriphagus boseongensis]|uniref:Aryl-alcohol dehydrogenase-like predicted oxidoreductase n=1 Tax=Algoriphagus boseongensis TaxID=1442587 RepID=A0A4R6T5U1_9BACT|nr:aldo/keto reductase [Algoriphagus boseongensis]TDQ18280.1 aryl-alcohol dehydrogenase-like predicted oxidoreductase [Algoriphagus boseongensis]
MTANRYTELAPGLKISRVLNGLWQIADMERDGTKVDPNLAAKAMHAYVEAGFTTFDMADHYGSSEEIAGVYRQTYGKNSAQFFTKWVPSPDRITQDQVKKAVETALIRMKTDQIDLMQFHAWQYAHPSWVDCLFWLQELKKEGKIKHLGLTNFDTAHLSIVLNSGIEVVSNQICYSLLDQRAAGEMTQLCLKHGVKILAFGTVAGGFLSEKWLDKAEPKLDESLTWSQMKYKRFIDQAGGWASFQSLLRTLHQLAQKHQVSIATLASHYILNQPSVGGVIIGARLGQSEHITDQEKLFSISLNQEDQKMIKEQLETLHKIPGDCGDEYRKPPFLTASGDLSHHVESFPAPYPTQAGGDGRTKALSGTIWEDIAGFSRAVRKGNRILVSGTTATHGSRAMGGSDPGAQTHFILDKIEGAILSLGGKMDQVIRTRIFIRNVDQWEPISRAHGQRFAGIQPANTMVRADLIGDDYLVEIEAEAVVEN